MTTAALPVEMLKAIVDDVPAEDLLPVRAAAKTLNTLATPHAFRVLRAKTTLESVQKLAEALGTPDVAKHVKEIVIRDVGAKAGVDLFAPGKDTADEPEEETQEEPEEDQEELREALTSAIALFHTLPSLETVNVTFPPKFEEQDEADSRQLQSTILESLAAHPLKLKSLSLANLATGPSELYAKPEFEALLKPLTELRISTISDQGQMGWYDEEPCIDFWQMVQTRLLTLPENLTSLALHSDIEIGWAPEFRFVELNYPKLASLSLKNVVFNEEIGIEDFIVRHKDTLTRLDLQRCPVVLPDEGEERHWSEIYQRLGTELTNLKHIDIQNENGDCTLNYAMLDSGVGFQYVTMEDDGQVEEDNAAQDAFMKEIRSRTDA
ncbi:hypothetical protein EVG20_g1794 [Dentipellis fragilis]|uniref:F-box domain-containing protein n=1 Tax=Dentipellis fragilis TaxID=205917 RepID=A0A4Y9ZBK8_9AGAM|nr:hypothetical protein EVG20_g1794 [Dentipellis fragilis]